VYDKFLTLNMTEYKRVMFLDADVIPLTNLDYYFHLSDPDCKDLPTLLKPNFILASEKEPCNTGMFYVEPSARSFEEYKEVVRKQHEKAKTLPYPHFDKKEGWGYNFKTNNDNWESVKKKGGAWTWHAGHSDQGLMYYLAKFLQKDVSIAIGDRIQNWKAVDGQERPEMESDTTGVLAKYQPELTAYQYSCDKYLSNSNVAEDEIKNQWRCNPPYDSVAHFMGKTKPWQKRFNMESATDWTYGLKAVKTRWFKELDELNKELKMGLDLWHWNDKHLEEMKESALGYQAMYSDQQHIIEGRGNQADEKEARV